jgi:hypothetical protein
VSAASAFAVLDFGGLRRRATPMARGRPAAAGRRPRGLAPGFAKRRVDDEVWC